MVYLYPLNEYNLSLSLSTPNGVNADIHIHIVTTVCHSGTDLPVTVLIRNSGRVVALVFLSSGEEPSTRSTLRWEHVPNYIA